MSIRDAKVQNTNLTDSNFRMGAGYDPLKLGNLHSSMFCKIAFDYLSFTIPFTQNYQDQYDKCCELLMLDFNKSRKQSTSRYGYNSCTVWKNELNQDKETFTAFYASGGEFNKNGFGEHTGMFELTGDGCRALESRGGDKFPDMWKFIFDSLIYSIKHCSITRFDFAIDVFNADFSLDELQTELINRNVYSPFQKFDYSKGTFFKSDEVDAHIIYLGSRKSDMFLCIYDKKEERESIGKEVDFKSWYRFEFRFKHKQAMNVILNIINKWNDEEALANFAGSLISKYVSVRVRPSKGKFKENGIIATNDAMRKWDVSPKWEKFIGIINYAKIENYFRYESTITKNAKWYARSVSKSLAKLFVSNPKYFYLFIQQCLVEGLTRFQKDDESLINDFREMYDFEKLSGTDIDEISERLKIDIEQYIRDYGEELCDPDSGEIKGYGIKHDV